MVHDAFALGVKLHEHFLRAGLNSTKRYNRLRSEAKQLRPFVFATQIDHYGDCLVYLYLSIFQHRKAKVEADLSLIPARQLMSDILEGHIKEVKQVADGLPSTVNGEVVQLHHAASRFPRLHLITMFENRISWLGR